MAALATLVEGPTPLVGAKLLIENSETRTITTGSTGDTMLDEAVARQAEVFLAARHEAQTLRIGDFAHALEKWRETRVMFERLAPEPHIVVCGAGHVGASLARLADMIGYRVTLIDDRADFVERRRFPEEGIELVAAPSWDEAVRACTGTGRGVSIAVVTRGHNEDEECLRAVLAVKPDYIGMIGSRRRTNIVLERLREKGFDEAELREVRAPIGLDIGAVAPEEVALAILAEIVAVRRRGTCAPLSEWRRKER